MTNLLNAAPKTMSDLVDALNDRIKRTNPEDQIDRIDAFTFDFSNGEAKAVKKDGQTLHLYRRGLVQLLERLQIPVRFFDRCPDNLKWANVNHFAQKGGYDKNVMLRKVYGDRVRGILSNRYAPLDDNQTIPYVERELRGQDVTVDIGDVNDIDYSHVRILFNQTEKEVRKGDLVKLGLHISNSEVGLRSVRIEPMVYRLVCTNGLTVPETILRTSLRHVGDPARLEQNIHEAIAKGIQEGQKLMGLFEQSVAVAVNDPQKLISDHAKAKNLTEAQLRLVLDAFEIEPEDNLFGVVNAFTRGAQQASSVEERYGLERTGGMLLSRV